MDDRIKVYQEKMQKAVDFMESEFATIRADGQIPMYLIRSGLIITELPHPYSRSETSPFPNPGSFRSLRGKRNLSKISRRLSWLRM